MDGKKLTKQIQKIEFFIKDSYFVPKHISRNFTDTQKINKYKLNKYKLKKSLKGKTGE